ncbi:MAG TPA: phospholipase C, phosphocholine-specific [Puia sp.]|jgi:phospholipase C
MDTRREFLRKSLLLSGAAGLSSFLPASIQRALEIDPELGSTFLDAEHIVILMQENRSFDHCFGSLQGVRGFNDPRVHIQPDQKPVWFQTNEKGEVYAPFRLDIKDTKVTWMGSLPHSRASQVDAYNKGKYDQWLIAKCSDNEKYGKMPLTLGHYTREDLPFHYAMADAFTICDQNFCSAMTSTTPNRSFFWTGKITYEENGLQKANIRNSDYTPARLPWHTFPELLEDSHISWKFYQNELDCVGGFKGEERSWLSNYGCNPLESFAAYNVKFAFWYVWSLKNQVEALPDQIAQLQRANPSGEEAIRKNREAIRKKQEVLDTAKAELKEWDPANFDKLTEREKNLHHKAFVTNSKDENYRTLASLKYADGDKERQMTVPGGDILYQFGEDVRDNKLPAVSWIAGPQNFSDHPSAPWYGAWYVSEILDILTENPEVWKKTIFIVTYDENDGYFDHIPPFSIPDSNLPGTGKCSAGIDTEIEQVRLNNELQQGIPKNQAREAPVGLGFRVPMLIASPWSRGGKVCSQVFDHTSTLQFLETFLNKKFNKNIRMDNISEWRRTICGDLTAVFSPFEEKPLEKLPFLSRQKHFEAIYNAKFKEEPSGYRPITHAEIVKWQEQPGTINLMSPQEAGIRRSPSLPYELYVDGKYDTEHKQLTLAMEAGTGLWGKKAAGAPFTVYAPGKYTDATGSDTGRQWSFAVKAGDRITYDWPLDAFADHRYHLRVYGPNGYYRELKGAGNDPLPVIDCLYERNALTQKATGNVLLRIVNPQPQKKSMIEIKDNGYGMNNRTVVLNEATQNVVLSLDKSYGWYDFSIKLPGVDAFERRYAGRVETGKESFSDPVMGRV